MASVNAERGFLPAVEEITPVSHDDFTRVKFLGNVYWITSNRTDDEALLEKDYVVIEKKVNASGITTLGGSRKGEKAKGCELIDK
ncbi:MAG: hypothetical protein Q9171_005485 [Xanthocarpia ochracea]